MSCVSFLPQSRNRCDGEVCVCVIVWWTSPYVPMCVYFPNVTHTSQFVLVKKRKKKLVRVQLYILQHSLGQHLGFQHAICARFSVYVSRICCSCLESICVCQTPMSLEFFIFYFLQGSLPNPCYLHLPDEIAFPLLDRGQWAGLIRNQDANKTEGEPLCWSSMPLGGELQTFLQHFH